MAKKIKTRIIRARNSSPFSAITRAFSTILSNPLFILGVAAAIYLSADDSLLDKLVAKFQKVAFLKPLGDYLKDHKKQAINFIAVSSSTFAAPPRYHIPLVFLAAFISFELIPVKAKVYEGVLLGLLMTLLFKVRSSRNKIIIVILGLITIGLGWVTLQAVQADDSLPPFEPVEAQNWDRITVQPPKFPNGG